MILTPKQKAEELVEKMAIYHWTTDVCDYEGAKQCALINIKEMYNIASELDNVKYMNYLTDVETEIKKL